MSERKIYIKFLEADVTGIISLYEDVAPKTCDAIWGALHQPIQWPALHAAFTGPEIMMGLPESARTFDPRSLGPENITSFPAAGELLWFYQPKNYFKMDPDEFWEVGLVYGEGARTAGPVGWTAPNFWGKVTENFEAVVEQCRVIRRKGERMVELGRVT